VETGFLQFLYVSYNFCKRFCKTYFFVRAQTVVGFLQTVVGFYVSYKKTRVLSRETMYHSRSTIHLINDWITLLF
jgi:hypothetical protein